MMQLSRSKTKLQHAITRTRKAMISPTRHPQASQLSISSLKTSNIPYIAMVVRPFSNLQPRFHQYNNHSRDHSNNMVPIAMAAAACTSVIFMEKKNKSGCDAGPVVEISREERLDREKKGDFSHLHNEWDSYMHSTIYGDEDDDDDDDDEEDEDDEEEDEDVDVKENDDVEPGEKLEEEPEEINSEDDEMKVDTIITPEPELKPESELEHEPNSTNTDLSIFEQEPDYSLLPKEDEQTTCSICLINRQGPCRDPWRWFEKCMKLTSPPPPDQDEDDNTTTKNNEDNDSETDTNTTTSSNPGFNACMKASMTWMECVNDHRALYSYYTNRHFQPELDRIEETIDSESRYPNFPDGMFPSLDLVSFHEFMDVKDAMMEDGDGLEALSDSSPQNSEAETIEDEKNTASTQSVPPQHLIPSYAKMELKDKMTDYPIELGYIKDQNGALLGFDYFTTEKKENASTGDMTFHLTPETKSVTIYALYRKPMVQSIDTKSDVITKPTGEGESDLNIETAQSETKTPNRDESIEKKEVTIPKFEEKLYFSVLDVSKDLELDNDVE